MAQLEYATGRNYIAAAPAGKAAYEGHKGHGVLTYAILEALHRPKGAAADPVSVFGIAAHISREVPAISQKTFGIRQQPRFTPTGEDFPLGVRAVVLKDAPPPIPTVPTHVNTAQLTVFKDATCTGAVLQQLQPFTPLALVESKEGCAQIAASGKVIGYVPESRLQKLAGAGGAQMTAAGGEKTDIKEHPWQVAIEVDGVLCGGVIVAQRWVLTAAHCFLPSYKSVRVKAGATNYRTGGAWTGVDRVVLHKFDDKTWDNDLALVKLKARPAGRSIPLARPDLKLEHCQRLEVTGWGRTETGKRSDTLLKAVVPHVDTKTCNEPASHGGQVRPSMLCAGFHKIDTCQGDSGGPLVLKSKDNNDEGDVLVGIVSWGPRLCGQEFKYGVYTRVSAHRDWITKVITTDR
jgi:V8-like Glu-specific endopeptidase